MALGPEYIYALTDPDDERRQLASSLRQIAARCEQAARDLASNE